MILLTLDSTMTVMAVWIVASTTTVTQAACDSTATSPDPSDVPVAEVADTGEVGYAPEPAHGIVHGGKRDLQLPDYIASYQPSEVSSACTCLASTQAAAMTITATSTVIGITDVSVFPL